MTPAELQAIKARLEKATPGPWDVYDFGVYSTTKINTLGEPTNICGEVTWEDAELIAHAPADIATLLAEVERWKKECEKLISLRSPMGQGESFSRLDEIIDAMKILKEQHDEARAEVGRLQKELDESARLHGMGSSREAKLLAENEKLRRVAEAAKRYMRPQDYIKKEELTAGRIWSIGDELQQALAGLEGEK